MARLYSMDLRERVVQAVEQEGLSRRQAADRFGIGIKTAIDWVSRFRETGSMAAKPTLGSLDCV
jgi:putative transposase